MPRRSLLYSPADRPELMRKAPDAGADAICFDLEDAVAPARTDEARAAVREVLTDPGFDPAAEVSVRLTGEEPGVDLAAIAGPEARLDAVMIPKAESAAAADRVAALCRDHDAPPTVLAVVETAAGVLSARAIAGAEATDAVLFGAEDLSADLGATRTDEGTEVLYAREHVVLAAAAAGVEAIDTLHTDFADEAGLAEDAAFGRDLGYDGKMAIHPAQVPVINEAYTPDPDRIDWAREVIAARRAAAEDDRGVFEVDGEMIDAPLIAQAERVLELARAANAIDPDDDPVA